MPRDFITCDGKSPPHHWPPRRIPHAYIELASAPARSVSRPPPTRAAADREPSQHDLAERARHGRCLRNPLGRFARRYPAVTSRTIHIGASFAIVLVAYWAYALLALPWIETQAKITSRGTGDNATTPPPPPPRDKDLEVLFWPNEWERHYAKSFRQQWPGPAALEELQESLATAGSISIR